jgi:hypothetical protein
MPTNYPAGPDDFPSIAGSDLLNSPTKPHATLHTNMGDAIEAIQAELGNNPSDGVSSYATVKARLAAMDTAISTHTHAGTVASSIVDAKGDILVGSANDTVARLPVGANTQVPIADSTQATGIRWGAVPTDLTKFDGGGKLNEANLPLYHPPMRVLNLAEAVPGGTPAGTIILRRPT